MKLITKQQYYNNGTAMYPNVTIQEFFYYDAIKTVFNLKLLMQSINNGITKDLGICSLFFKGMNGELDASKTSFKACTFAFNNAPDTHLDLMTYLGENQGVFPALNDITVIDWGYPNFETVFSFFTGGQIGANVEAAKIHPVNDFIKAWLLNNVAFNGEKIDVQFQFEN